MSICLVLAAAFAGDGKLEFNRDIRPILAENCFACHGPDSAARKADLRLDLRDAAVAAGALTPGKPAESELLARIGSANPKKAMPPPATQKHVRPEQAALLKRWIEQGAEYQAHWSFLPPQRVAPPRGAAGARNAIDGFLDAKLAEKGLARAPEADRRTLVRRLSLDLRGVPPAPAEVAAAVADAAPDWYERLVDRFLASPQWGEHRGRYWLDYARYADTHGIHFDNYREMWSYRDWVIGAFNRNQPFDRFAVEQLAGDLLPGATLEQQVASGFNRCNMTSNEGGAIDEEYRVLYARDRTETASLVWMGLTTGCAVCHDHKFDPISTKEFYSLSSFFNNTTQAAMDGNVKDTPPILPLPRPEDRARFAVLEREAAASEAAIARRRAAAKEDFARWQAQAKPAELRAAAPAAGLVLHAPLDDGQGKEVAASVGGKSRRLAYANGDVPKWSAYGLYGHPALQMNGASPIPVPDAGDFESDRPFAVAAWVRHSRPGQQAALVARIDEDAGFRGWDMWFQNGRIGTHLVSKWPEDALKVVALADVPLHKWTHVAVSYDGSKKASGIAIHYNGRKVPTKTEADGLRGSMRAKVPFHVGGRSKSATVATAALFDLRLYDRVLSGADAALLADGGRAAAALAVAGKKIDVFSEPPPAGALDDYYFRQVDPATKAEAARLATVEAERQTLLVRGTIAHVMRERPQMPEAYVLFRGDYDKRRDKVGPETPKALPPFPVGAPRNRLGLAQWLVAPEHPLAARVAVNRFWQELFGTGLVRTSGDFGVAGELPSHPELLDWLAVEFRAGGWDVKRLFKLLATSAAYRQAATVAPEKLAADPDNRLLSRAARFRMDAEMVRDSALAASGLLVDKIGGPSVRPYQPDGVWEAVAMPESDTRAYRRDRGESLYRRSLYTFWKRAAPPASLEILNAPAREVCTVRRERTNTPIQALVTLNDPQFVEAARALAERVLRAPAADDGARIDLLAERLLARPFAPAEREIARASLAQLSADYAAQPAEAEKLLKVGDSPRDPALPAPRHAAWTMLANELMNLDEFLCK